MSDKPDDFHSAWMSFKEENPDATNITTLDAPARNEQYLFNRLYNAFSSGFSFGAEIERKNVLRRLEKLLWPGAKIISPMTLLRKSSKTKLGMAASASRGTAPKH